MTQNKPRRLGTAKRLREHKAIRGQVNELEIANINLQAENKQLEDYIQTRQSTSEYEEGQINANTALVNKVAHLREIISDKNEQLLTIKQLSEPYAELIGTDKEAPWVRAMGVICVQAEQALQEKNG